MAKITNNNKLRFKLTEEMNNMMIELLVTEQMMKENKLTKKERKLLENHKAKLLEDFRKEFQKNNIQQIKKYNELMNK